MALRNLDPFAQLPETLPSDSNPYVSMVRDNISLPLSYGPALKGKKGKWRETFSVQPEKLFLEVGCHLGKTIIEMAADHPECGFIGLDITFKRVVTTARRAQERGLQNIHVMLLNGQFIDEVFAPSEIDGMMVFFPDPWSKKRQAKHRLVNKTFLKSASQTLKPDGFFWLKTDQRPYFDFAKSAAEGIGFEPIHRTSPSGFAPYETTFERKFRQQDIGSSAGIWQPPRPN